MNLGDLKTSDWEKLQAIADRFERDWQFCSTGDKPPELADYLPPVGEALRLPALHELIKTDLEICCRRGHAVDLEKYVERFPELGSKDELPTSLIYEEYRVRQTHGDRPPAETYQSRFPKQFTELQALIKERALETLAAPTEKTPADSPAPAAAAGVSQAVPTTGDFLAGYKWIKKIGSGGFGEVWLAEAPGGVPVAIKKIFRPLDNAESVRERESLELIKRLRHAFLLGTQAFEQREDRLFIVMELADGSLRDRVKECKKAGLDNIPLPELVNYFREAADALDYLHSEKVLHRDVKPDNILRVKQHTKLADFGLARVLGNHGMVSASGSGTPAYMAPEVWRGKVCEQSDQYSLALAYAELRMTKRPFEGRDMMEVMIDHMERPPHLDPLPDPEQAVLRKALAKDPKDRYATCREFIQALEQALAPILGASSPSFVHLTVQAPRPSPRTPDVPARETEDQLAGVMAADPRSSAPLLRPTAIEPDKQAVGWRDEKQALQGRPTVRSYRPLVILGVLVIACGLAAILAWKSFSRSTSGTAVVSSEVDYVPAGCVKAEGAYVVTIEGKKYYSRIDSILPDKTPVRFILIPRLRGSDPDTFYMMENKVWAGLFKKFAAAKPEFVKSSEWTKGPKAEGKDMGIENERLPVFNVGVEAAHYFARWLGGYLPSTHQWDKAAGLYEENPGQGPFLEPWDEKDNTQIAIQRGKEGPMEIGTASKDVSPFGVRDMAGNGREWTRNLSLDAQNRQVPISNPGRDDFVWLRGHEYYHDQPLLFKDLEAIRAGKIVNAEYKSVSPYTSFRVVLELPQGG